LKGGSKLEIVLTGVVNSSSAVSQAFESYNNPKYRDFLGGSFNNQYDYKDAVDAINTVNSTYLFLRSLDLLNTNRYLYFNSSYADNPDDKFKANTEERYDLTYAGKIAGHWFWGTPTLIPLLPISP
jgi:hypothetical protein